MDKLVFDEHGPVNDRRWMLIDAGGAMVTQRNTPRLARVDVKPVEDQGLKVSARGAPDLFIEPPSPTLPLTEVEVWRDPVWGREAGDAAAHWFSIIAGKSVRLLQLAPEKQRERSWNAHHFTVGFADGYPLLLCHEASLADLNRRLAKGNIAPVPMDRFRPNIVVAGDEPWAEDHWESLQTDEGVIRCATGCARCTVTTVDQKSGRVPAKGEPLATLARFRKTDNGVFFGRNALGLPAGSHLMRGEAHTLRSQPQECGDFCSKD